MTVPGRAEAKQGRNAFDNCGVTERIPALLSEQDGEEGKKMSAARCCIIPVFVPHLGCPHRCVFCDQRSISGMGRPPEPAEAARTIADALRRLPEDRPAEVAFYGGSFTAIPVGEQEAMLDAAAPFLRSGRVARIRVSTRPDCVDGETLERLARRGVRTVELGAQSMDGEVLRLSRRGHTAEDVERAAGLVGEYGLNLILQMMTGLPGDTDEKALETGRRLAALRPDGVRIYPAVVVKGTELHRMWQRGEYRPQTVPEAAELCAGLLELMERENIPVIRVGLSPSRELEEQVAAGAYHPALGELARSRLWYRRAAAVLRDVPAGAAVELGVRSGAVSPMVGQKRENVLKLCREFSLRSLKIRAVTGAGQAVVLLAVAPSGNI